MGCCNVIACTIPILLPTPEHARNTRRAPSFTTCLSVPSFLKPLPRLPPSPFLRLSLTPSLLLPRRLVRVFCNNPFQLLRRDGDGGDKAAVGGAARIDRAGESRQGEAQGGPAQGVLLVGEAGLRAVQRPGAGARDLRAPSALRSECGPCPWCVRVGLARVRHPSLCRHPLSCGHARSRHSLHRWCCVTRQRETRRSTWCLGDLLGVFEFGRKYNQIWCFKVCAWVSLLEAVVEIVLLVCDRPHRW